MSIVEMRTVHMFSPLKEVVKGYIFWTLWSGYPSAGALMGCLLHCTWGVLLHPEQFTNRLYLNSPHILIVSSHTLIKPYFGFTT
jgi:hypothetical protein